MAVDAMRRLSHFHTLEEYRYVGMGGYEFIDFDLVHRALGVHHMTSIESQVDEARLRFNRPFPDIELKIGTSNEILPAVPFGRPLIVWMDYCSKLRHDVLQDVRLLGEKLQPGSMLVVTVNAASGDPEGRLARLEGDVGPDRIPMDVGDDRDLDGWATAEVQRKILLTEIAAGLAQRNASTRFEQVLNVQYKDTRRMQTVGGIFVDAQSEGKFNAADYPSLDYVRTGDSALTINVPVLTAREVLELESKLKASGPAHTLAWLDSREAESFAELHRWYPRVPAPM